jgi:hypothetical protein
MTNQIAQKVYLVSQLGMSLTGLNRWISQSAIGRPLKASEWSRIALTGNCEGIDLEALESAIDGYLTMVGELAPELQIGE